MNEMIWVVQKDVFNNEAKIIEALIKSNTRYELLDKPDLILASKTRSFLGNDSITNNTINVFFYGSTHMMPMIERKTKWAHCCTLNNYECHRYYPIFREFMLNKDYYLLPFGELKHVKSARAFSYRVFVKPDKGFKTFNGHVINLEEDWTPQLGDIDDHDLIVVTSPKEVIEEYRFVICNDKIVSGCKYLPEESWHVDTEVYTYANSLLNRYKPDPAYTIDVAKTCTGYKMLELNSFSCAELYSCDLVKVINSVNNEMLRLVEDQICSLT